MKKLLAVLITLCAALPLLAQSKTRYLISMRHPAAVSGLRLVRDITEAVAHDVRAFSNVDFVAADLSDVEAAELKRSSDVRFIVPVVPRSLDSVETPVTHRIETQSRYSKAQVVPYGIDLVHARDVWPYTRGKTRILISRIAIRADTTRSRRRTIRWTIMAMGLTCPGSSGPRTTTSVSSV